MLAFIAPTAGRVDIAIALALFLVVHLSQVTIAVAPHRPSPSICHRAVHRRPRPSPLCSRSIAAALVPSLAVEEPLCAVPRSRGAFAPSLTVEEPSRHPSLSRSHRAVHCRRGAVAPYLTIKEPSAMSTDNSGHSSCPSKPHVVRLVVTLPLLMPPPPICRRLSLRPLPFVPLIRPASCPVSLLLMPPPPSASHHAVASYCHAHLGPHVRLVKATHLLTPSPPICGIIESSQRSSLMLV